MKPQLQVPVSLHIFNRPETTARVFEEIRRQRPKRLFVTADGPRPNRPGDREKCAQTRGIVDQIDWDCEVTRFFSDLNLGSFRSTSSGITRVFDAVDRAIILEDDCVPDPSFFRFCEELLDRYEHDQRVALIAGNNLLPDLTGNSNSYYFSRNTHMWGWATWRRTWQQVDFTMNDWPGFRDSGGLQKVFAKRHQVDYWHTIMQQMYDGRTGLHWDYLLLLSMYMNGSLAVKPEVNLITNTGFGEDATHFSRRLRIHDVARESISFPLRHPPDISRHHASDEQTEYHVFSRGRRDYLEKKLAMLLPGPALRVLRDVKRRWFGYKS